MTNINLLPWREKKREQEKKTFTTVLLSSVVISALIVFLVNYYADSLVSNQLGRNKILENEITVLDDQIKEIKSLKTVRAGLISRMAIVQNLQSTRTLMVHLFDELITVIPSGIFLTKVERKNDVVTLWGYAESNTNVSDLMENIEKSDYMQNPVLIEIKNMEDKKQSADNQFNLSFVLKPKKLGI